MDGNNEEWKKIKLDLRSMNKKVTIQGYEGSFHQVAAIAKIANTFFIKFVLN